jgi:HEAT repeat protein
MPELVGDLRPFIVQILHPLSRMSEGTGFLCRPDGLVLTCWHVMGTWHQCKITEGEVRFDDQIYTAQWLIDRSDEAADLAILKLTRPEARDVPHLPLDVHWRVQMADELASFGYPKGPFKSGVPVGPKLQGLTPTHVEGWDSDLYILMGFNLDDIDEGYSGAPVINMRTQKVIGLMNAKHHETQAFMVPLAPLFVQWPVLKEYHDIYRHIRDQFAIDAQKKFDQQIRETTFIPLALEQGRVPKAPERDAEQEGEEAAHGRQWQALDLKQLLPPRDRRILVADVGAGKTTWLLWLVGALVDKTHAIPLFLTCSELEQSQVRHWVDLQNKLISRYEAEFLAVDLKDFLDQAFQEKRLVFLLDGLDQIKVLRYADLARTAFEIAGANSVLISARPSAVLALESDPNVIFLRLQSFSDDEERQYFGQYYDSAQRLLILAPELARVPMLAYMIRTLVKVRLTAGVETRTEIYQQFVQYILLKHEPNATISGEDWTLSRNLSKALSTLAYRALAETQIQRFEADLADRVLGEMLRNSILQQPVSIEQLSTFGFINRVLEQGENRLLFFTHQSFQEFLAAQYLIEDEHESERNKVLAERWNPKWKQVIQFLAGLKGEQILEALLEAPDNIIHANLFIAASCVPELKAINLINVKRIEQGIVPLLEQVPFREDARKAVGALGHAHAPIDPALAERLVSSFDEVSVSGSKEVVPALAALSERFTPAQVNVIVARLSNKDSDVREAAVAVLSRLRERLSSEQVDMIVARLSDERRYVREAAVEALGRVGERLSSGQVDMIVARLSDKKWDVREAAVEALGRVGERLSSGLVDMIVALLSNKDSDVRRAAAVALGRVGERLSSGQVDMIVALLSDKDSDVRRAAAVALGRVGERLSSGQVDMIVALLSNVDSDVRWAAVEALGRVGERLIPGQVDMIVALLSNKDSIVRDAAAVALGRVGDRLSSGQVDALVARLSDEDSSVREAAVEALGRVGERLTPGQADALVALLTDEASSVRRAAAVALGRVGERLTPGQVDALVALLSNKDSIVRWAAAVVLGRVGERLSSGQAHALVALLSNKDSDVRRAAAVALGRVGERLSSGQVDMIVALLSDEDSRVREAAVEALGCVRERLTPGQVDMIVALLSNKDSDVRRAAAVALGRVRERLSSGQVDALVALLSDKNWYVCEAAAVALGRVRERLTPGQVDALVALLSNKDSTVREAAVEALGRVGDRLSSGQAHALVALLSNKDSIVREAAVEALGRVGDRLSSGQVDALVARLSDEDSIVREAAVEALGCVGERLTPGQVDALIALLSNKDSSVRRAAAVALGRVRERLSSGQVNALVALLSNKDSSVRRAAAVALGRVRERLTPGQVDALVTLLNDESRYVREAVLKVLGGVGKRLDHEQMNTIVAQLLDKHTKRREEAYDLLKYLYHQGYPLPILV